LLAGGDLRFLRQFWWHGWLGWGMWGRLSACSRASARLRTSAGRCRNQTSAGWKPGGSQDWLPTNCHPCAS